VKIAQLRAFHDLDRQGGRTEGELPTVKSEEAIRSELEQNEEQRGD
jgi:hypothetical protein